MLSSIMYGVLNFLSFPSPCLLFNKKHVDSLVMVIYATFSALKMKAEGSVVQGHLQYMASTMKPAWDT